MLFAEAGQYYHRGQTPAFSSEAMPTLKEAVVYLEKAAKTFPEDNPKDRIFKSQPIFSGDIYHYGLVSLSKAKDDYQMAVNLLPQNETAQKELLLVEQELKTK